MDILTAKVNEIEMDWFSFGTGKRAFVIIPGLSLKSVMLSAKAIKGAYKDFAEDYTVYVFDRRKNVQDGYSVREMAADTAEVMKHIGIESADIFGASQGGMMAQYMAIDFPELVHSIILASTCSRSDENTEKLFEKWISLAENHDVQRLNHSFFETIYSDELLAQYADVLPIMEKEGTAEECDNFVIFAKACIEFDSYDELEKIKCPVFVIGAEHDRALSGSASYELAEKLGCELYMYEKYGHAVYDEAPDYKERLLKFLRKI